MYIEKSFDNLANTVAEYLKNTDEYVYLNRAREKVANDRQLSMKLYAFEERRNSAAFAANENLMLELEAEYNRLAQTPLLNEYFQALNTFTAVFDNFISDVGERLYSGPR